MPYITIPFSSNPFSYEAIIPKVLIAGQVRTDCFCTDCTTSDGKTFGSATLIFPDADYDSEMALENDLVELAVNDQIFWRGYIVERDSGNTEKLAYRAIDLLSKFDDTFFWEHEYNYTDSVTKEKKYPVSYRQIASDAYGLYLGWKTANCDDDALLTIDLETVPDVYCNETKLVNKPLFQALQSELETYNYKLRLGVIHTNDASVIYCYTLGEGTPKLINRGLDPDNSYQDQPNGPAFVKDVKKTVNATNSISHLLAFGDYRIVETALDTNQNFNLVENDFTPPTGHSIKEYVTLVEQDQVINNWDKYTKEKIDIKEGDKFKQSAFNPNYRKKYEKVCREYKIQTVDDTWHYLDNPIDYPAVYGDDVAIPKIESKLVQSFDGSDMSPFIVYRKCNDDTLYVKTDGFSIKDSRYLIFSKPFVESISNILAKGTFGCCSTDVPYNTTTCTSQYIAMGTVNEDIPDLTELLTTELIESDESVWLVLGEYGTAYEITAVEAQGEGEDVAYVLTVKGNLTGAGIEKLDKNGVSYNPKQYEKGAHWYIWHSNKTPLYACAGTGEGMVGGKYQLKSTGSETIDNSFAGNTLILGDYDSSLQAWKTAPKDLQVYTVSSSSEKFVWINDLNKSLVGSPAKYQIISLPQSHNIPIAWFHLNCAYKSDQPLMWYSGDLGTLQNKRIVPKENKDYKWTSMKDNYILIPSETAGEEDKFVVFDGSTLYPDGVDKQNDLTALTAWAQNQIQGADSYQVQYNISLGVFDFGLMLGDKVVDSAIDSGATVTAINYDFQNQTMNITADSWV